MALLPALAADGWLKITSSRSLHALSGGYNPSSHTCTILQDTLKGNLPRRQISSRATAQQVTTDASTLASIPPFQHDIAQLEDVTFPRASEWGHSGKIPSLF